MQVVNGYVCFNCTDVERAKKGADPTESAVRPTTPELRADDLRRDQRVRESAAGEGPHGDANKPLNHGDRGRVLNLVA